MINSVRIVLIKAWRKNANEMGENRLWKRKGFYCCYISKDNYVGLLCDVLNYKQNPM